MPAGGHMTTTSTHPKQRARKKFIPLQRRDLLIWASACFPSGGSCDLLYLTGRPPPLPRRGAMVPSRSAVGLSDVSPGPAVTACALFATTTSVPDLRLGSAAGGSGSARSRADNGGFAVKTSAGLDLLIARYCNLEPCPRFAGVIDYRRFFSQLLLSP